MGLCTLCIAQLAWLLFISTFIIYLFIYCNCVLVPSSIFSYSREFFSNLKKCIIYFPVPSKTMYHLKTSSQITSKNSGQNTKGDWPPENLRTLENNQYWTNWAEKSNLKSDQYHSEFPILFNAFLLIFRLLPEGVPIKRLHSRQGQQLKRNHFFLARGLTKQSLCDV